MFPLTCISIFPCINIFCFHLETHIWLGLFRYFLLRAKTAVRCLVSEGPLCCFTTDYLLHDDRIRLHVPVKHHTYTKYTHGCVTLFPSRIHFLARQGTFWIWIFDHVNLRAPVKKFVLGKFAPANERRMPKHKMAGTVNHSSCVSFIF